MFKKLLNKKNIVLTVLTIVFVLYLVNRFMGNPLQENEEDFTQTSAQEIKDNKMPRLMYNIGNQRRNQVYELRGENMVIPKETVSFINESNIENNLLNERIVM